jgi:hypothetical protein
MRKWQIMGGLLAIALLNQGAAAQGRDTLLTGILGGLAPGSEVTWSSGVANAGVETYQNLFFSVGPARVRAASIQVSPNGPQARVEASGVVISLDGDDLFGVEIGGITLSLSAALVNRVSDLSGIPDLCQIGRGGNKVDLERVRIVGRGGLNTERGVRSELRLRNLSLSQETRPTAAGCEVKLSLRGGEITESRSDKSGLSLSDLQASLSLPGSVETLVAGSAPDLALSAKVGGVEVLLPGGGAVANMRDGTVTFTAPALSAVPALTAYLRTRGAGPAEREKAVAEALLPADITLTADLNGTSILAEALIPAQLISGLSRASLTTLIGDYEASIRSKGGDMRVQAASRITGVGETRAGADLRIYAGSNDQSPLGVWPRLESLIPRVYLSGAEITHRDEGLLRAIELISGSPVSVLAALYLRDGAEATPERWRPALRRAVSELARFFALTTSAQGARVQIETPEGLSVQEAYLLLSFRPELVNDLIITQIGPNPERPD